MAKSHLARNEAIIQRAKQSMTRVRTARRGVELMAWGKAGLFAGSVLIPVAENYIPLSFLKIPTKIWATALAYGISALTRGAVQRVAMQMGDAIFAVYVYKATARVQGGMPQPLIAGEEDDEVGVLEEV